MLLCRCDTYAAEFITSVQDPRDHPYILGATRPVVSLIEALEDGKKAGKGYLDVKAQWKAGAGLLTFDDAVETVTTLEQYNAYMAEVSRKLVSLQQRRAIAKRITGQEIVFDWELPRTPLGQYLYQSNLQAVVERCILAAPLGDVTWSRIGKQSSPQHDTAPSSLVHA